MKATEQPCPMKLCFSGNKGGSNFWFCGYKCFSLTIQTKAIEPPFPVKMFTTMYWVIPTFESVDEILKCDHTNPKGYFPAVLFIMLFVVALTLWVWLNSPFKVIPFNCITHPFCASFLAWLARARARAPSELYRFFMKAELFREINGRFLLNEPGDPHFLWHKLKWHTV